jgi:hypothetical protein
MYSNDLAEVFEQIVALKKTTLVQQAIERMGSSDLATLFEQIVELNEPTLMQQALEQMNPGDLAKIFEQIVELNEPTKNEAVLELLKARLRALATQKIADLNLPKLALDLLFQSSPAATPAQPVLSAAPVTPATQLGIAEINKALQSLPYYLDKALIRQLHAAVHTLPRFVILAGPPGTGKTAVAMLYIAAYLGIAGRYTQLPTLKAVLQKLQEDGDFQTHCQMVRVRPEWTNPKDVLGFCDIQGKFREGVIYRLLKAAELDPGHLFFIILDEMNLSHPEHYLSDIISAMETGGEIALDAPQQPVKYCRNVVLMGTINRDETVQNLSPRLLSRAFNIEVRANWNLIQTNGDSRRQRVKEVLSKLDQELQKAGLGFGYRDFDQAVEFLENYSGDSGKEQEGAWEKGMDLFLCNKLITKIRGTQEQFESDGGNVIDGLLKILAQYSLDHEETAQKLGEKKVSLAKLGFAL